MQAILKALFTGIKDFCTNFRNFKNVFEMFKQSLIYIGVPTTRTK